MRTWTQWYREVTVTGCIQVLRSASRLYLTSPLSPKFWRKLQPIFRNVERRHLSTREITIFVADPQTENGPFLSWKVESFSSFTLGYVHQTLGGHFHPAFHDWTRSGLTVVAEVLPFQSKPSLKLVRTNRSGSKGWSWWRALIGNDQLPFANFRREGLFFETMNGRPWFYTKPSTFWKPWSGLLTFCHTNVFS